LNRLRLRPARGYWARLCGLHACGPPDPDTGLWLSPCNAVHTLGLAYAIDVVFLDRSHRIIKKVEALAPNGFAFCPRAASVVELPAGYCAAHGAHAALIRRAVRRLA